MNKQQLFHTTLLEWYAQHKRHLPWRSTRDSYRVLVSEIMLQQTQVDRVLAYYAAFLKKFPTLTALATASDADVLRMWSGLGYNRRALNLKKTAQALQGKPFPETEDALKRLPGIGPYTAGALLAFASNKKVVFADINITRLISRYFGVSEKKIVSTLQTLVAVAESPHDWYSALMDFGAALCTSKPLCSQCPLQATCIAYPAILDETPSSRTTAKFLGSNRWWRGRILKALLKKPLTEQELYQVTSVERKDRRTFLDALVALQEDGLVKRRREKYTI